LLLSSDRSSGFSEFNAGSFKGTPNRLESAGVWYVFPTFYVHHCAAINSRPLCQIALSPPQQRASYPDFRDSHKSEKMTCQVATGLVMPKEAMASATIEEKARAKALATQ
jgi:hypothetical protein